jgi:hypothetical protein
MISQRNESEHTCILIQSTSELNNFCRTEMVNLTSAFIVFGPTTSQRVGAMWFDEKCTINNEMKETE